MHVSTAVYAADAHVSTTIRTYDWEGGYCMHVSTTVYAADNTYIRLGRRVLYAR